MRNLKLRKINQPNIYIALALPDLQFYDLPIANVSNWAKWYAQWVENSHFEKGHTTSKKTQKKLSKYSTWVGFFLPGHVLTYLCVFKSIAFSC